MKRTNKRPLSPHISIYRWQWSMIYSILHRATGIILSVGLLLLVSFLAMIAFFPTFYPSVASLLASPIAFIFLLGWSWTLFYHLCNGARFWLFAKNIGISLAAASKTGHLVCVLSLILTAAFWYGIFTF